MQQRVGIARAFAVKPEILLMDEPFSALDMVARHDILEYVISFKQAGGIVILASHEESALKACDKVYLIDSGNVSLVEEGDGNFVDILRKSSTK